MLAGAFVGTETRRRPELSGATMAISVAGVGKTGSGATPEGASARGSACSTWTTTVERTDTAAQHGDDGGRGFHYGAGAAASAMVRESEGEELGRRGCVCELGGEVGDRPRVAERRGEEAERRAAAWHALVPTSSTWLPAWLSQAARWSGGWAGPADGLARWAARLVPSLFFISIFYLFL